MDYLLLVTVFYPTFGLVVGKPVTLELSMAIAPDLMSVSVGL